jgi:type IV secretory pathway TrbD component
MQYDAIPIHSSLVRPVLLAGAERNITICVVTFCLCVVACVFPAGIISSKFMLTSLAMWGFYKILMVFARNSAKIDPQRFMIYWRHIKYVEFYPAQAKLKRNSTTHWRKMIGFK